MIIFRLVPILILAWTSLAQSAAPQRVLLDMAETPVHVPQRVERVVTIGPVPVLNSLIFALGEGRSIANGLPEFAKHPRWAYQTVFAPHISKLPTMQNPDNTPDLEALLLTGPDAVLTMDRASAERMRRAGLPALYLAWTKPEEVKAAVHLLGQLYSRPDAADRYVERFDDTLTNVATKLRNSSPIRPRVLYFNPSTLTQPHLVVEWWIKAAGGESVTDNGRSIESRSFTMEQLLAWNPDFLIVVSREDAEIVLREPRFADLAAVRNRRLLVAPCAAHTWSNRTAEQPLTVLWAAKQFHPSLFSDVDLAAETQRFYRDIFGVDLTSSQIEEILAGGPRVSPHRY
ncbi:MAG: ABC transporter substrate-binding protein [Methylomonas sp.]|nr:ABC transporter substrate-binding protein [Methylomonas sp.]